MKTLKKTLIVVASSLMTTFSAFSQNHTILVKPAGGDNWGYANIKGEMIIPAAYRRCYSFSEGLAVVFSEQTKKFIIITPTGDQLKTQIDNFEVRSGFGLGEVGYNDGMLPVYSNKKWGYLDNKGNLAIPLNYEKASEFNGGYAVVTKDGKTIIIDKKGNEKTASDSRVLSINRFTEGLAPFSDAEKKTGFVDVTGKVVIEPKFKSVGFFHGGIAWAKTLEGKVGFIDKTGQWIIQPTYTAAKDFDTKSGLAVVKTEAGALYINKEGKTQSINPSETFENFSNGLCEGKKATLWGFYDATGKWVVQPELQGVRAFKNGYAAAKKDNKWGIINKEGKWVIEPVFTTVKDVETH